MKIHEIKGYKYIYVITIIVLLFIGFYILCNLKNVPIINSNGTVEYQFSEQSQLHAGNILYNYILNSLNMNAKEAKNFAQITKNKIRAFEFDLNGDGQKEIIGLCYSTFYESTEGLDLFILKLNNKGYQNISSIKILPNEKLKIYNSKINNYKTIQSVIYLNSERLKGNFVKYSVDAYFDKYIYIYKI